MSDKVKPQEIFEDEIPWSDIRYPEIGPSTNTSSDLVKYWYKARGISRMGFSASWEGGLSAAKIGATLGIVKNKSLVWNCRQLDYIAIYDYDINGELNEDTPVLSQAFVNENQPFIPRARTPHTHIHYDPPGKDEIEWYNISPVFIEQEMETQFSTLTPIVKEQKDDNLNRS